MKLEMWKDGEIFFRTLLQPVMSVLEDITLQGYVEADKFFLKVILAFATCSTALVVWLPAASAFAKLSWQNFNISGTLCLKEVPSSSYSC